jgi:hypothetical protein
MAQQVELGASHEGCGIALAAFQHERSPGSFIHMWRKM